MPHVHSPDGVYLASTLETHSKNDTLLEAFFEPDTKKKVDGALSRVWQELEKLAAAERFGLTNLLLSLNIKVFSEAPLCPRLRFFVDLTKAVEAELKCPAIENPFCIEEYRSANEKLQKQFLGEALTTFWEAIVFPELKKSGGDLQLNYPASLEAIRLCLARPDLTPHLLKKTSLDLTRLLFRTLPQEIGAFRHVQHLNLSDLPLTDFSPNLSGLTYLKEVCLRNFPLTTFCADFTPCVEFTSLYVNSTRLQHFSMRLAPASKLEHIDLSNNELQGFEVDLSSQGHLKHLSLARNFLQGFTTNLAFCTELRHLNLSNNRLAHFHPDLRGCSQLAILNLYDNRLPSLAIHTEGPMALSGLLARLAGD